jgi:hypothetical protein
MVNFTLQALHPPEKEPPVPIGLEGWVGPTTGIKRRGEEKKIMPLPGLELRTYGHRNRSQPENKTYDYNHAFFGGWGGGSFFWCSFNLSAGWQQLEFPRLDASIASPFN